MALYDIFATMPRSENDADGASALLTENFAHSEPNRTLGALSAVLFDPQPLRHSQTRRVPQTPLVTHQRPMYQCDDVID